MTRKIGGGVRWCLVRWGGEACLRRLKAPLKRGLKNPRNLESITVEAENPDYYSLTNCVIDKKTGDIVVGCGGSIIPKDSNVTCIKQKAF